SVQRPRGVILILGPDLGLAKFYEPTGMGFPRVYPDYPGWSYMLPLYIYVGIFDSLIGWGWALNMRCVLKSKFFF
ncbi:MAG: hypothetical protein EBS19_03345, partial [Spirochaetia bacterium]|nr:hypothetical protein [Spirochaetia bacterium]